MIRERANSSQQTLRQEALYFVRVSLVVSAALAALKVGMGWYSGSHALMVNAVYSLNDVLSSIAVAVSLRVGYRRPSPKYAYGYGKAEFIAVGMVSITITLFVCFMVVYSVTSAIRGAKAPPHYAAALLAAVSMVVTWSLARSAHRLGRLLQSPALDTAAGHYHSDAIGSLAALFGVGGAMLGFHSLDITIAFIEEVHLMALSGSLLGAATKGLMDAAIPPEDRQLVKTACGDVEGVLRVAHVRSRRLGSETWVDVGVVVAAQTTVSQAHAIADSVKRKVGAVLGPAAATQVRCQGPEFAYVAPGPGGNAHG